MGSGRLLMRETGVLRQDERVMRKWLPWLLFALAALTYLFALQAARPLPFTTTDDNWMSELALIKAHTDAALEGAPLRMLWGLGAGWDPFESGQRGLLYPIYHLSNLVARALGSPLWLLEVSAVLHIALLGVMLLLLGERRAPASERVAWAFCAMTLPGPLLLGLNWHDYLAPAPWFLGLSLVLSRNLDAELPWSRRDRLTVFLLAMAMFLASHVQMYVIGILLLFVWVALERPELRFLFATGKVLAFCQLPLLIPLWFLVQAAGNATASWMAARDDPMFLLHHAQPLSAVLSGSLFGNFWDLPSFYIWDGVESSGIGMLFNIPMLFCLIVGLLRRRWGLVALSMACLLFLAAKDFPFIRHIAVGPLAGFRWTWKLVIWTGPLFLVASIRFMPHVLPGAALRTITVVTIGVLSCLVCIRGTSFDLLPALRVGHPLGADVIAQEARQCFESAGLAPGTRLALVGEHDMVRPLPLPVLTMLGNAPLLAGYESAHLFEPLESAYAAEGHYGLSLPWRGAISGLDYQARSQEIDDSLEAIGVQALVSAYSDVFSPGSAFECTDSVGGTTWLKRLPNAAPFSYPWAEVDGDRVPLERLPGGKLLFRGESAGPPTAITPRAIEWKRRSDDSWIGSPEPIARGWIVLVVLFCGLTPLLLVSHRIFPNDRSKCL